MNLKVKLKVFKDLGQEVTTIYNNYLSAGIHHVTFNANNPNSRVYLYTLEANGADGTNFYGYKIDDLGQRVFLFV